MPRKRRNATDVFSSAVDTAEVIHQRDQVAETKAQEDRGTQEFHGPFELMLEIPKIFGKIFNKLSLMTNKSD